MKNSLHMGPSTDQLDCLRLLPWPPSAEVGLGPCCSESPGPLCHQALAHCKPRSVGTTAALTHPSHSLQLMEALKEQEEINFRLRQYMDKIILAILDHNPSILEIKH